MKKLLLLLLILLDTALFAQTKRDSLHDTWVNQNNPDTVRFEAMSQFINIYIYAQPDTVLELSGKLIAAAKSKGNLRWQALGHQKRIAALNGQSKYSEGRVYGDSSLELYQKIGDKRGAAEASYNLSIGYHLQGNAARAFEYCSQSAKLFKEIRALKEVSYCYNFIGIILADQGRYEDAQAYYQMGYELSDSLGFYSSMSMFATGLGNVHHKLGNNVKSLLYFRQSLEIDNRVGNKEGIAVDLGNIGAWYERNDSLDKAISYFTQSLALCNQIDKLDQKSIVLTSIAVVYKKKNELDNALQYARQSLDVSLALGSVYHIEVSAKILSEVYEKMNNGLKALEMYKLQIQMRDSMKSEENKKGILKLEIQHEFEKEQLIEKQKSEEMERLAMLQQERRNSIQYSGIGVGLFALFGLVFLFGRIQLPKWAVELSVFLPFLIFFEFLLVISDPYVDSWSDGIPLIKLGINVLMAGLIFPLHAFFEQLLKGRIFIKNNKPKS